MSLANSNVDYLEKNMTALLSEYEDLYAKFGKEMSNTLLLTQHKFAEIRRQIKTQRNMFKEKIDQLASSIISRANAAERIYINALLRYKDRNTKKLNINQLRQSKIKYQRIS